MGNYRRTLFCDGKHGLLFESNRGEDMSIMELYYGHYRENAQNEYLPKIAFKKYLGTDNKKPLKNHYEQVANKYKSI